MQIKINENIQMKVDEFIRKNLEKIQSQTP